MELGNLTAREIMQGLAYELTIDRDEEIIHLPAEDMVMTLFTALDDLEQDLKEEPTIYCTRCSKLIFFFQHEKAFKINGVGPIYRIHLDCAQNNIPGNWVEVELTVPYIEGGDLENRNN